MLPEYHASVTQPIKYKESHIFVMFAPDLLFLQKAVLPQNYYPTLSWLTVLRALRAMPAGPLSPVGPPRPDTS